MQSNFRFCALVLAVSLCGCAQKVMPPPPPLLNPPGADPQITLKIQQSSTVLPGYLATYGKNGKMYVYQFTGGNRKHGNLEYKVGDGHSNIHIKLDASSNFAITDVPIDGNSNHQLMSTVQNPNMAKIYNENTDVVDAYYAVNILDSAAPPGDIICDPGIINNR